MKSTVGNGGQGAAPNLQAYAQALLFHQFRQHREYDAIIRQDLRPLWLEAYHTPIGEWLVFSFHTMVSMTAKWPFFDGQERVQHEYSAINHYVDALCATTRSRLRLTDIMGRAPIWALSHLHLDVSEREQARPLSWTTDSEVELELIGNGLCHKTRIYDRKMPSVELRLSAESLTLDIDGPLVVAESGLDYVHRRIWPTGGVLMNDAHWDRLEAEAIDAVRRGIQSMRKQLEARHDPRRPTKLEAMKSDAARAVDWLLHKRRPVERNDRRRVRDLLSLAGVEPPAQ